jgi:transposase
MGEEIHMTKREISRADVFGEISQKKVSQAKAAEILGISARHVRRLYSEFKKKGVASLVSRHRGKPSNHQLPRHVRARVMELVTCEKYEGFRPTFMCEKLTELHGITICTETTRQLMIQSGVWEVHKKKSPVIHQQRKRRARFGELIQIDGSPHAWFEDRGDPCVLIVFIDDATGHTYGKFFQAETTEAYMTTTKEYIMKYGRPLAFYPDKHGIFRINRPGCLKKELMTQFGRACKELDIDLFCANSPQAKGRVERCNQTQQDRLIKELRLANLSTIEEANKFLPKYWDLFNKKFAVVAESKEDAHRKITSEHDIDKILCYKSDRIISKNLEVQYNNTVYQIEEKTHSRSLQRAKVTVVEDLKGGIHLLHKGRYLPFKIHSQQQCKGEEVNSKEIDQFLKVHTKRNMPDDHPWRQQGNAERAFRQYQRM